MKDNIAIIIPAYKRDFFEQTLESLKNQTSKKFHVYIGDDNSPENLYEIIEKFSNYFPVTYKKFEDNLGKEDLVSHWERCLKMKGDEDYFVIFSDDDLLASDFIEIALEEIRKNPDVDVFHSILKIIDEKNQIIKKESKKGKFPTTITSREFLDLLISEKITARMPDFIFKSAGFKGFVNFPLAMRSDNATVILNAQTNGIRQLNSTILWRSSNKNICSNLFKNKDFYFKSIEAEKKFYFWVKNYFNGNINDHKLRKNMFLNFKCCPLYFLTREEWQFSFQEFNWTFYEQIQINGIIPMIKQLKTLKQILLKKII